MLIGARAALHARALALGYVVSHETDVHVVADGERIEPMRLGAERIAFVIPAGRMAIDLRCRTFVPAQTDPASGDPRELGLCIGRLQLDGADVPLEAEALDRAGWHALEQRADGGPRRWTRASAPLPTGTRLVVIEVSGASHYWTEPQPAAMALCG